ncbi:MAG: hypothetical protein R2932_32230 [Caldilineaceae bacterium]
MSTEKINSEERTYREWLTEALNGVEFTVESLSSTAGRVMTAATPFLAGFGSAAAITFAFAEQSHSMFDLIWPGVALGIVLGGAVEGMNIASVYNRDRAYAHNRRTDDAAKRVSTSVGDTIVRYSILVTFGIVFALETVPSAYAWYIGEMAAMHALFRICLIILPFMSRIGAMLYAFVAEINAVDTYAREAKRISERQEAEDDLIAELDRQRIIDEYNRQKAVEDANAAANVRKAENRSVGRSRSKAPDSTMSASVTTGKSDKISESDNVRSDNQSDNQSDNRRQHVLDILTEHMSLGATEIHRLIGGDEVCTRSTLYEDLKALAKDGLVHNADRKWHIGQAIETPEPIAFSTNGVGRSPATAEQL